MSLFSGVENFIEKIKERIKLESKPSPYRFAAENYAEIVKRLEAQGIKKFEDAPDVYPINFSLGNPTVPIYKKVLDKGIEFLQSALDKVLNYTNFQGDDNLREKAVKAFTKAHDLEEKKYNKDNMIFTVGANGAIELILDFSSKIMGHKKVLMPHPTFGSYIPMANNAGLEACLMDTTEDDYKVKSAKVDKALTEMMDQEKRRIKTYIDNVDLIEKNIQAGLYESLGDLQKQTGISFSKEQKEIYRQFKKGRKQDQSKLDEFFSKIKTSLEIEKTKLSTQLGNITPETYSCLFLLPDPPNHTGRKQSNEDLDDIAKLLSEKWKNVIVAGDHLYRDLTFPGNSKDTLLDRGIKHGNEHILNNYMYVDSISKTDGASSLRCGAVFCVHHEFNKALANNQLLKGVHPSHTAQVMYVAAMETRHEYVEKTAAIYANKSNFVSSELIKIGVVDTKKQPNSTIYLEADASFLSNIELSEAEMKKIKSYKPDFESKKVGNDPIAASVVLTYRLNIVTSALYNPEGELVDYVGSDGKIPEQKPLIRIVPTPEDPILEQAVKRITRLKQEIDKGNVDYNVNVPETGLGYYGSPTNAFRHHQYSRAV